MKNYLMTRNADSDFDTLFDDVFGNWGIRNSTYPTVNVYEDSKAFYVEAELPGYTSDEVNIDVEKHVLHISSEKTENKEDKKYVVRERGYIKFNRSFSLPEGINEDAIEAEFKNGILTVTLPKLPVQQSRHWYRFLPQTAPAQAMQRNRRRRASAATPVRIIKPLFFSYNTPPGNNIKLL